MKGKTFAEKYGAHVAPKETLTAMKARGATKEEWGQIYFDKGDKCEVEGCVYLFDRAHSKALHYARTCGLKPKHRNKDQTTGKVINTLTKEERKQRAEVAKEAKENRENGTKGKKVKAKITEVELKLAKKVWAMYEAKKLPLQTKGLDQIRKIMEKKAVAGVEVFYNTSGISHFRPSWVTEASTTLLSIIVEHYKAKGVDLFEVEEEEEEDFEIYEDVEEEEEVEVEEVEVEEVEEEETGEGETTGDETTGEETTGDEETGDDIYEGE